MLKQNLFKSAVLIAAAVCMFLLAACGAEPTKETTEQAAPQTVVETKNDQPVPASPVTEPESQPETKPESQPESQPATEPSEAPDAAVAKISGGADEVGIYSVVVRLTDQAADKGVVELVYYGAKGSPQENSVVNTFRIEYYRESSGTFEISTFFNGEVYQNLHHKDEVKVTNTFGATLRAGSVVVSYTPDGGDTQEIFSADAAYFSASAK